jgi:protein-S-isoprenylcysteine O-methyltransferase Ste14
MPSLAIMLWISYVAVAFGLRAWLQLRALGPSGLVPLRAIRGARERLTSLLVAAALGGGFTSVALALLWPDVRAWSVWTSDRSVLGVGLVVYAFGLAATFVAQLAMGASWRIGVDHSQRTDLVARGPFRWVRNPIFSAMRVTGAGLVLIAPSWCALASYGLLWIALELHVRGVEEPYLLRTHGDAYRTYAARTGRFVPYVGRGL